MFSPVNLWRCKKRKRMATARTAEQFVKIHSKISYNDDKRYGREDGRDPVKIVSPKKRENTFTKPILKEIIFFEINFLSIHETQ